MINLARLTLIGNILIMEVRSELKSLMMHKDLDWNKHIKNIAQSLLLISKNSKKETIVNQLVKQIAFPENKSLIWNRYQYPLLLHQQMQYLKMLKTRN